MVQRYNRLNYFNTIASCRRTCRYIYIVSDSNKKKYTVITWRNSTKTLIFIFITRSRFNFIFIFFNHPREMKKKMFKNKINNSENAIKSPGFSISCVLGTRLESVPLKYKIYMQIWVPRMIILCIKRAMRFTNINRHDFVSCITNYYKTRVHNLFADLIFKKYL